MNTPSTATPTVTPELVAEFARRFLAYQDAYDCELAWLEETAERIAAAFPAAPTKTAEGGAA